MPFLQAKRDRWLLPRSLRVSLWVAVLDLRSEVCSLNLHRMCLFRDFQL